MAPFPTSGENSPLVESLQVKLFAAKKEIRCDVVRCISEHVDARVTVALAHDSGLQLPIGRPVQVEFPALGLTERVTLTGRVVERSEDARGINYEIFFPRAAAGALSALVNRRAALRVTPASDQPVRVQLRAFAGAFEVGLLAHDISAAGVALRLSPSLESRLSGARKVELVIQLPEPFGSHSLPGFILRRRLTGAHVEYGIHFEEKGTVMQREAIQRWALTRQGPETRAAG